MRIAQLVPLAESFLRSSGTEREARPFPEAGFASVSDDATVEDVKGRRRCC